MAKTTKRSSKQGTARSGGSATRGGAKVPAKSGAKASSPHAGSSRPRAAAKAATPKPALAQKPAARSGQRPTPVAAKKHAGAARSGAGTLAVVYTLDDLLQVVGEPDEALMRLLFRGIDEEALLNLGWRVETEDLLDAVPSFVGSLREIYGVLSPAQRKLLVGYTPRLDALLVHETVKLRELDTQLHEDSREVAGTRAGVKRRLRDAIRQGVLLRDQAARTLRRIVPQAEADELEAVKGTAETPSELSEGLVQMARLVEEHRRPEAAALYDELGLTAEYVAELREQAQAVRRAAADEEAAAPEAEARVQKRALDLQDGVVFRLGEIAYRAFREAQWRDPSILLPQLGRLASLLDRRARQAEKEASRKHGAGKPASG